MKTKLLLLSILILIVSVYPAQADTTQTIYMPGVRNSWYGVIDPPPGEYPLEYINPGEMVAVVDYPGCHSAWVDFGKIVPNDRTYFEYHQECGPTGHATILISFYSYVAVTDVTINVMTYDGVIVTRIVPGEWIYR